MKLLCPLHLDEVLKGGYHTVPVRQKHNVLKCPFKDCEQSLILVGPYKETQPQKGESFQLSWIFEGTEGKTVHMPV